MKVSTIIVRLSFLSLITSFLLTSCDHKMSEEEVAAYKVAHQKWQQERIEKLKAPNGYVNLAGLYILNKGLSTFGSDSSNKIVFPEKAPAFLGKLRVTNTKSVLYEAPSEPVVMMKETGKDSIWEAPALQLVYDDSMHMSLQMSHEALTWFVIKRGDELAVRLRDFENPKLDSLQSIDSYPVDVNWVVTAEFEPYDPPKVLKIQNILGITYDQPSPGRLVFEKDGEEYALDVTEEGDEFFVTYADETTGEETYGGGRYMYTTKPNSSGEVVMDFNKGYNPPCVYTPFATCPLPPPQNKLKVAILAGEKFARHY
ncbi:MULTISPECIES: DUF1684 domain-containing protein [unclassified Imperialibacter]|uniref:DUF1684 domain-containing protein n=2 Tax=Imperialibacter TaxID=1649461 RepID=UPI00125FEE4A|nr:MULTISPECIES: DUF1684 domain-containing protein [unclassified Imperialibacter]